MGTPEFIGIDWGMGDCTARVIVEIDADGNQRILLPKEYAIERIKEQPFY